MSARDFVRILFGRKRWVAAGLLLGLAGAFAAMEAGEPWRAEATLLAEDGAPALAARLEGREPPPGADLAVRAEEGGLVRVAIDHHDPAAAAAALEALLADAREIRARDPGRQARLDGARAEAEALAGRLAVLQRRLAETPATIVLSSESERSRVLEDARAKLFEIETRKRELLGKYREESPLVKALEAERLGVERALREHDRPLAARSREGANEVHQSLEKEVFRTEAALTEARALAAALAGAEGGGPPGVAVTGVAAPRRVGPRREFLAAGAVLAGLMAGFLLALAAERLSGRFSSPADVERRLGLPVLATIPREG